MEVEDQKYWLDRDFIPELLKQLPSYVFWKDTNCTFLGCNDAFAHASGFSSPQEIIGKTDFDLSTTKEESAAYQTDDEDVMRSRKPKLNIEETQTTPDGRQIILLTNKVPLLNKKGEVIGVLGIYSDITERKSLEKALHQSKENAEAANRAKTEFIQNMSHDIRTPLAGVIGAATLLEKSVKTKDERNIARMIHDSGQRLLDLLNGVLDVVSTENINDADVHKETLDLSDRIQVLHDLILPIVKTKGIHLTFDIDSTIPRYVVTDRLKIERILLNLLGNAIKFTNKGEVGLYVKVLSCDKDKVHLEFIVTDSGIGIPKEMLHQVFDRFFRINPSFKGIHQGHGIGLYIVKKYVNLLGGEVHVSSEEEKGTTFRFALQMGIGHASDARAFVANELSGTATLNLAEAKISKPAAKAEVSRGIKGALKVLFIEDDFIASKVGTDILHNVGCTVHTVHDAETALLLFKRQHFDLVVSDVGLPGMSGNEFAALIRFWEKFNDKPPVPIIALTSHVAGQARDECFLAGMNEVLIKPLSEEKAQNILEEFCELSTQKVTKGSQKGVKKSSGTTKKMAPRLLTEPH